MFQKIDEISNWGELEDAVVRLFSEMGYVAKRKKDVPLANGGTAQVDVLAVREEMPPTHRILVECKFWNSKVPRAVVQALKMDVIESGANFGIIISKNGHQKGAYLGVALTNVYIFTFEDFQKYFAQLWVSQNLLPLWDRYNIVSADALKLNRQSPEGQLFHKQLDAAGLLHLRERLQALTFTVARAFLQGMHDFGHGTKVLRRDRKVRIWLMNQPGDGWEYSYSNARGF